ncbi:MAG: amidophosphoribosyltransferase [Gemmatimonadetes bacterium]|nr:amidophosphoribosyltransferase [Gemmatimonadota bacterium]
MCGIVAVNGAPKACEAAFLALYALQHRGQEAAGIYTFNRDDGAHIRKREGLVGDVFKPWSLAKLTGETAIGHVRYSTAGGGGSDNAQPTTAQFSGGALALAHNGNLTNHLTLRKWLVEEGAIFRGTSDSEVLVHLIAKSRHHTPDARLDDALQHLEGAFSMVLAINDVVYAARDARGLRPLVLGRLDPGWVVASETCSLDILGAEYERDLEPGEVVRFESGRKRPMRSLPPAASSTPCVFEHVYFSRPDSRIDGRSVDAARRMMGRRLAREHPAEADAVISVPDSANSVALGYSEESGISFELGLLRHHYVGRTFIKPSQRDRDFAARMKYNTVDEVIAGKRIVVVDDSLVRGTTSRSLVRMLRAAGASEVHFRIGSPPVRWPCFYGIDMPTRGELIAATMEPEEIRARLGVESLAYLSLEGMIEVASNGNSSFCDACFSGNYRAPLVDVEKGLASAEGPHCN